MNDFMELRELINTSSFEFDLYSRHSNIKVRSLDFIERVGNSLKMVNDSIDYHALNRLVHDIYKYEKISILGLLKAGTVAMNLQSDLLILGKVANTKISFMQQMEYIKNATEKDLIIIFSYKGDSNVYAVHRDNYI